MKPLKELKFHLCPNTWIRIKYIDKNSHGEYDIQIDYYHVYKAKFDKLLKGCQIAEVIKYERNGI